MASILKESGGKSYIYKAHKALLQCERDLKEVLIEGSKLSQRYDKIQANFLERGLLLEEFGVIPETAGFSSRMEDTPLGGRKVFYLDTGDYTLSMWHVDGCKWTVQSSLWKMPIVCDIPNMSVFIILMRAFGLVMDVEKIMELI